jgi:hypothetical protein
MILARVEQDQGVAESVAPYRHMGDVSGRGLAIRSHPARARGTLRAGH